MSHEGLLHDDGLSSNEQRFYSLIEEDGAMEISLMATMETSSTYRNARMLYDYKTFIPNERVGISNSACRGGISGTGYFAGDNRSWRTPTAAVDYRTRVQVEANWTGGYVGFKKWVNSTREYKSSTSTTVVRSATASSKNIYMHSVKRSSSSASFKIYHSAGMPLCRFAGPIWYTVTGTMWRNGSASFTGSRARAPRHESYVLGNRDYTWITVMRRELQAFYCLSNPLCGEDSWSKTFTKTI